MRNLTKQHTEQITLMYLSETPCHFISNSIENRNSVLSLKKQSYLHNLLIDVSIVI